MSRPATIVATVDPADEFVSVERQIEIALAASHGVELTREWILKMAAQGRMSVRKPHEDGPRVRPEELALRPHEIPPSWVWLRLGSIASLQIGRTPPTKEAKYWAEQGFPWVSIADMPSRGSVFATRRSVSSRAISECFGSRFADKGTLLMSFKLSIGKVAVLEMDAVHNEAIVAIRPDARVTQDYLLWLLPFLSKGGASKSAIKGSTLNSESLAALPIPVPPLAEQKRIVAKVDQLMALCDELEAKQAKKRDLGDRLTKASVAALTKAATPEEFKVASQRVHEQFALLVDTESAVEELRGAVLDLAVRGLLPVPSTTGETGVEVAESASATGAREGVARARLDRADFGDLAILPHGWTWARMGDVFEVAGGLQKTPARAPRKNHYPYLRVENVQRGRLLLDRIERFELAAGELERLRLERGDLLVVEGNGSDREIGRCAIWGGEIHDCVHQNHLIRCRARGKISPEFTLLFLNSPTGKAEMRSLAVTTSGLYSLSVGKVKSVAVPVPPPEVAVQLLRLVRGLTALCDQLRESLASRRATASHLAEALVGQSTGLPARAAGAQRGSSEQTEGR